MQNPSHCPVIIGSFDQNSGKVGLPSQPSLQELSSVSYTNNLFEPLVSLTLKVASTATFNKNDKKRLILNAEHFSQRLVFSLSNKNNDIAAVTGNDNESDNSRDCVALVEA